jgi:CRISPR-associated protein Csx10
VTGRGVLRVTVTARQRLALGVGSEVSFFTSTHRYAPGSVLRGALAAAWITENGPPSAGNDAAGFRELFDGPVRYGPLFVPGSAVMPVSARRCKYPHDDKDCRSQAVDAAFEAGSRCPACSGPLEPGKGQVILPGGVSLERVTRTSISPVTGKAADGELYANGALPAGTTLTGYIYGRSPWLERTRRLRLGGRRTVSGSAEYEAAPLQAAEEEQLPFEWPGLPADMSTTSAVPGGEDARVIIRLASPAVFVDAAGRPSLEPDPDLDLGGATVKRRWARPVIWSGWHAASRLPKPDETCAAAGSTYEVTGPAPVLRDLAERLPWEGTGLRRSEGFGDIRIARRPWRPPAPAAAQDAGVPAGTDTAVFGWLRELRRLDLEPPQLRWVTDALRELQLAREYQASAAGSRDVVAGLLDRAAAGGFSGRQRQSLTALFGKPDPRRLRDLTMLLLAEQAGTGEGGTR